MSATVASRKLNSAVQRPANTTACAMIGIMTFRQSINLFAPQMKDCLLKFLTNLKQGCGNDPRRVRYSGHDVRNCNARDGVIEGKPRQPLSCCYFSDVSRDASKIEAAIAG